MLRWHLQGIFKFAVAEEAIERNPARGEVTRVLLPRKKHHAKARDAIPFEEVRRFLELLRTYRKDGEYPVQALILEMQVFSGVRHKEPRFAKWKEIDLDKEVWIVPPENLKMGKKHDKSRPVPLTKPMLNLFKIAESRRTDPSIEALVFPPKQGRGHVAPNKISDVTRELISNYKWDIPVMPHGFRTTLQFFRDKNTQWDQDLVDRQLDHIPKNHTTVSMRYTDLVRSGAEVPSLDQRREMMEAYARVCDPAAYQ